MFKIINLMSLWPGISSEHGLNKDGAMWLNLKCNGNLHIRTGLGGTTDGFSSMVSMSGDSMAKNIGGMRLFGSSETFSV